MYPPESPAGMEQEPLQAEPAQVDPVIDQFEQQRQQEEIKKALEDLLRKARDEDRAVRWEYVKIWKRLEYYFNNVLDIFQGPDGDWIVPDWSKLEGEVPPRLINVYRPTAEAVIAALTSKVPGVFFAPDDADNPFDISASKAYRTISELLDHHNKAPMMAIRALSILFNQGTIFGYNYYHENPKYGTLPKPKIEFKDIALYESYCPNCGGIMDAGQMGQMDESGQGGGPAPLIQCMNCGYQGPPQVNQSTEQLPQIVGFDSTPKGSICQEFYSGLQVKVPAFASKQEDCGYLLLEFMQSVGMLRSLFKESAGKIQGRRADREPWQFLKTPLQYFNQIPDNAANVSCLWLRPWQFYEIGQGEDEITQALLKQFPDGCYALFINEEIMGVWPEKMDDHWTISDNPFSKYIYARPLGENAATIQDIRAELTELELQTIEHGIPETFADPNVLDFEKYGEGQSKPGMVTQAKPKAGKSLGDAFYVSKPAILSQEVDPFRASVDRDLQFVTGAYPSIYGGAGGGSETATEYEQSQAMALQRLGTIYSIWGNFRAQFQSRSVTEYANVLKALGRDERFVKRQAGGFVNTWIRSSELTGKIGRCEPENTDRLPVSWAQQSDKIMQYMTSGVPEVIGVLTNPNNAELLKKAAGVPDLYIPGEEARERQLKELVWLAQGVPVPIKPTDTHEVHIEIIKSYMEGEQGDLVIPEAYQAIMDHYTMHEMELAKQMEAQAEQEENSKPDNKNLNKGKSDSKGDVSNAG